MTTEEVLILIKPDAMAKCLAGNILNDLYSLNLRIIGLKLVKVQRDLAERHYSEHKGKPSFEKLIKHITGEFHNSENVIAIVYKGENAIKRARELAGATHPEDAHPTSLRGKYGRVHSKTDCFENVIHVSDSKKSAEKEIALWFDKKELVE